MEWMAAFLVDGIVGRFPTTATDLLLKHNGDEWMRGPRDQSIGNPSAGRLPGG